ncbi:MAG: 1-deoxy-D-xylulose-5-phosphate reductoisomerase [Fimbriimonadaceae bacterium]
MKRVCILGSTGSIGTQTLDVIARLPEHLKVVSLAAASNGWKLREQAQAFGVSKLALFDEAAAKEFDLPAGIDAMCDLATADNVDIVVISVAGVVGLLPTLAAIRAKKHIALASKEVLVAAGEIVMPALKEHGVTMTPIDSEHSAVFQCMQGYRTDQIGELILTASGGPFRGRSRSDLAHITVQEALNHPTWKMGGKITIDSATLMNKGLETIEAKWLFDVPIEHVEVVVHPQSVVHSIVKFKDGSALGQMGWPDMRLPIQYALLYPERLDAQLRPWNPVDTPNLSFEPVDHGTFPALRLAREAARIGGTMPCVMNAANEATVARFLAGEIGFLQITELVAEKMAQHVAQPATFESLVEADKWARLA